MRSNRHTRFGRGDDFPNLPDINQFLSAGNSDQWTVIFFFSCLEKLYFVTNRYPREREKTNAIYQASSSMSEANFELIRNYQTRIDSQQFNFLQMNYFKFPQA